jgi:hypothetical protein
MHPNTIAGEDHELCYAFSGHTNRTISAVADRKTSYSPAQTL